jgi:hypothetical protein
MLDFLKTLDRRWIFLLMGLSVLLPIIFTKTFPEEPTVLAQNVFDEIENLPRGSNVLLAYDYDPASEGELSPMSTSFAYHCAAKGHKLYFMSLWPVGPQMVDDTVEDVIKPKFPDMVYGVDYVNLGYKSGYEGVIKVIITDFRALYTTDAKGTAWDAIPMCRDIKSVQDMDLIVNVSAGYAGTKEWVLYAVTPFPMTSVSWVAAPACRRRCCTPTSRSSFPGCLAAIKGASEYESLVIAKYGGENPDPKYMEAQRRMGPQLVAHVLMVVLIIAGNIIYFVERRKEKQS